jgi:hypothetical protein
MMLKRINCKSPEGLSARFACRLPPRTGLKLSRSNKLFLTTILFTYH